ncbi:MAG: SOS response-associated peptidase [Acetobacterales bacterium]
MCGRYSISTPAEALARLFGPLGPLPNLAPRYNLAPTQDAPVVRLTGAGARQLAMLRWGLVPSWSKGPGDGPLLINARSDTVRTKPSFRDAFHQRRCLVPADGFYEWKAEGREKQPWRVRRADGIPFAFAGLWDSWAGPQGERIESFAIVTTDAAASIAHIHHRMPVMLPHDATAAWLEGESAEAARLMEPLPDGELKAYPVSARVNTVANDDAALHEPISEEQARPVQRGLFG